METLKFKTTVRCDGCVAKITPYLNGMKGLDSWSVDLSDPQRILTVESSGVTAGEISQVLEKAGYKAEKMSS
jgi:copper chaperone